MTYGRFSKRRARRPYRARGRRTSKKTVKKAVYTAKRRNFAARVKSIVSRMSETKCVNYSFASKPCYNVASNDWVGSVLNLLPEASGASTTCYTIRQGEEQGERVGNMIQPHTLYLSGVIRCNQFYNETQNYNPCPIRVTIWVVKLKPHLTDSVNQLESVVDNSFFQLGDVSSGFNGTMIDLTRQPNKDMVSVLVKRSFYVGMGNYNSAFAVNSPNNGSQQYNQDGATMSKMFRMNLTRFIPKKLRFNDGSNTPTSARKLWCFITTQRADGAFSQTSTGNLTGPIPAYVDLSADFNFKDI
jgi:hypothetical protein